MFHSSGISKFFENHWERMLMWAILLGLFYLLNSFFLLIFATFLIAYITKGVVDWAVLRLKMNHQSATVIVFLLFVSLLVATAAWVGPRLLIESNYLLKEFAGDGEVQTKKRIDAFVSNTVVRIVGDQTGNAVIGSEQYTAMREMLRTETEKTLKAAVPQVIASLLHLVKVGGELLLAAVLAIVFAFFLVMDWQNIAATMRALETSRIRSFYLGAEPHLRAFAGVLGKSLQAQAIVAICNTVLTGIGLWLFGVPSVALLSTIVFFCGFVPILGTFISSIPILLFAVQAGGVGLMLKLIALISAVHAFEAYVLNPRITSRILRVHPLLILVLLLIGERFLGLWGLVVGVPIGCYVIGVLTEEDDTIARS